MAAEVVARGILWAVVSRRRPAWLAASRRRSNMRNPKPKWLLLYAVLPLGAALLVAADLLSPSAGWRTVAEGTAALVTLGLMALWVRANRVALALLDEPDETEAPFRAWVAYQPPVPRRRELVAQASESRPRSAA
jgi:hypothetical protein